MSIAEVVQLRDAPLVNDIPGQLRQLADSIERGEVEADQCICLVPQPDDFPTIYGWGEAFDNRIVLAQFELARHWLVRQMTP